MDKRMWRILLGDTNDLITSSVMVMLYPAARCHAVDSACVLFKIKLELPPLFPSL
jgi:hypothetical protein